MSLPDHVVAHNKYGAYCVPAASGWRPAAKAILEGKVWESRTISFIRRNCGHGDVVHAGAYFGDFLPGISKALLGTARLWAFEPNSANHACARRTLELNGIENTTLMHAGLGAREGSVTLKTGRASDPALGGASRVVKHRQAGGDYEEVRIVAIDDVVPPHRNVSIIQLDVEGSEQAALQGAMNTIRYGLPILILENLPKDPAWFEEAILNLGYRDAGKLHGNTVYRV